MTGIPGVTCSKCLGRIDPKLTESMNARQDKMGIPRTLPKVCGECLMTTLLNWAGSLEPEEEAK